MHSSYRVAQLAKDEVSGADIARLGPQANHREEHDSDKLRLRTLWSDDVEAKLATSQLLYLDLP